MKRRKPLSFVRVLKLHIYTNIYAVCKNFRAGAISISILRRVRSQPDHGLNRLNNIQSFHRTFSMHHALRPEHLNSGLY